MNNTTYNNKNEQNLPTVITVYIIVLCLYGIGVFLHVKIIMVAKKEKNLTWKIDISHSVLVLFLYAHMIYNHTITYVTPDIHKFTGDWLCYISKPVIVYTKLYITGHSMMISMLKYVIIVFDEKIRNKKEEIKNRFFWINIFCPVVQIAIQMVLSLSFYPNLDRVDGFLVINKCLVHSNPFSTCDFAKPMQNSSTEYVIYVIRRTICTGQIVLLFGIALNVLDMFFYCRIFSYMRR